MHRARKKEEPVKEPARRREVNIDLHGREPVNGTYFEVILTNYSCDNACGNKGAATESFTCTL